MSRAVIWESLYQTLLADVTLIALLGPVTQNNLRVYHSWPQFTSILTNYEPQSEGWLVIDEPEPGGGAGTQQADSIWEVIEPTFIVVATHFSLCDDVSDRIDLAYHWTVDQQRELTFGERIVLFTRRVGTKSTYNKEIKLYEKHLRYRMEMVVEEQLA